MLPPGQFELSTMPRFGLPEYANRFPKKPNDMSIRVCGEVENELILEDIFKQLPERRLTADFHCVTTWSIKNLRWEGVSFRDFFDSIVAQQAAPSYGISYCETISQDGYRSCLPLEDLLKDDVIIANRLNGEPLSIAHGAPIRLVAPAHYGYKNPKHVHTFGFYSKDRRPKKLLYRMITHTRGRVEQEERSTGIPGWLVRYFNRMLISGTRKQFQNALDEHLQSRNQQNDGS